MNRYSFRNIVENSASIFEDLYGNKLKSSPGLGRYKNNVNLKEGKIYDRNDGKISKKKL